MCIFHLTIPTSAQNHGNDVYLSFNNKNSSWRLWRLLYTATKSEVLVKIEVSKGVWSEWKCYWDGVYSIRLNIREDINAYVTLANPECIDNDSYVDVITCRKGRKISPSFPNFSVSQTVPSLECEQRSELQTDALISSSPMLFLCELSAYT